MSRRLHEPRARLIGEIERPATGETIRVRLLGDPPRHVDLRVFAATRSSCGEPRPSRAGLCVSLLDLPALVRALREAEEAVR